MQENAPEIEKSLNVYTKIAHHVLWKLIQKNQCRLIVIKLLDFKGGMKSIMLSEQNIKWLVKIGLTIWKPTYKARQQYRLIF